MDEIDPDHAFDTLFCEYEQPICSYLARLTGDLARAQELTQETFLRAYRALLRGARWDNPRAWLYRVASRLATDDYRRKKLLQWLPLLSTDPDPLPPVEARVSERQSVQQALDALSPKYRVPLVLYTSQHYSVGEVARILHISASAVKMRLSRAREMFRRVYRLAEQALSQDDKPALCRPTLAGGEVGGHLLEQDQ
ncbi:MAG: RNA polymerase sigma factor [Anaerolineae bacterium]|nr:RNA polymerase sigma factor [Anaerolineae bacterium]